MMTNQNLINTEKKFKEFLKYIFQFNKNQIDLNFGVYKIFKHKQNEIYDFIENQLSELVNIALDKENLKNEEKIKYKNIVFEHILNFFKHFYDKGDFYPVPIFSQSKDKKGAYCIDYNGEEVLFYWITKNQHYIKSLNYCNNYNFFINNTEIEFLINEVEDLNSNQKDTRKFLLTGEVDFQNDKVIIKIDYKKDNNGKELDVENLYSLLKENKIEIPKGDLEYHINKFKNLRSSDFFIHKHLKTFLIKELNYYLKNEIVDFEDERTLKEAKITKVVCEKIIEFLAKMEDLQLLLWEKKKFAYNVNYVITLDKLNLEIIEKIENSDGFENQKKEWIKELKLIDALPENIHKVFLYWEEIKDIKIHKEIFTEKYKQEWEKNFDTNEASIEEVFHKKFALLKEFLKRINIKKIKESLFYRNEYSKINNDLIEFYKKYKTLPIDTKHFEDLKYKILEQFEDLDDKIDGILIKSDNWQALNTIIPKYQNEVQTIYIDPPFNTGSDFLYKDNYQDATWLTLMESRLRLAKEFLKENGSLFLHLDENANFRGRELLNNFFNFIKEIIWNTNSTNDENTNLFSYKSFGMNFTRQHDIIYQSSKSENYKFNKPWKKENIGWLDILSNKECKQQGLKAFKFYLELWEKKQIKKKVINIENEKVYTIGDIWNDIFSFMQSEIRTSEGLGFQTQKPENLLRRIIQTTSDFNDLILDFFAGSGTTVAVAHKLGRKWIGIDLGENFDNTWKDVIEIDRKKIEEMKERIVQKIKVNSKNKSNKKIKVLVKKLGVLGRMKNVLYGDLEFDPLYTDKKRRPHLSKDINWQGGGCFKYLQLEQYEDTLNNIELKSFKSLNKKNEEIKKLKSIYPDLAEEGMLNILTDFILENSKALLLFIENYPLKNPFDFSLIINKKKQKIDLIETFNILANIKVEKVFERKFENKKYIFVIGGKDIVIWRELKENIENISDFILAEEKFIENIFKEKNIEVENKKNIYTNAVGEFPLQFLNKKAKDIAVELQKLLIKDIKCDTLNIEGKI